MKMKSDAEFRVTLATASTLLLAAPIWCLVLFEVSAHQPDSWAYGPVVLSAMTLAIHRLVRSIGNAWPLSGLIAGILSLGILLLSAG